MIFTKILSLYKQIPHKYALHLSSSYIQLVVNIIITILLTPYLIDRLGENLYGYWILLNSILLYLNLSSFGFGTTLLKEASHIKDNILLSKYMSTIFFLFIGIAAIIFIGGIFFSRYLDSVFLIPQGVSEITEITFIIFLITFCVNLVNSIFHTILFAKGYLHIEAYINILQIILSAIFIVGALEIGYSITMMTLVNLMLSGIFFIFTYFMAKKYSCFTIALQYFDRSLLESMTLPSFHYFIVGVTATIILYSDNIIISSYIGLASLAVYAIGYKVVDLSQRILFKLVDVMIPDIATLYVQKEYVKIYRLHNKMLIYSTILGILGYGFLFLFGLDIIAFWVGEKYVIAGDIFSVFLCFGVWHTWVHVSAIFNVAMGEHKFPSYMGIVNAILNIILSIILLEDYGLFGVALGTLISHILTNGWFSNFWFYKNIKEKINQEASDV
jgi:O-antigen/teichoic acid export membrane protein